MYNRYVPQPDGSHHRRQVQEQAAPQTPISDPVHNHPQESAYCPPPVKEAGPVSLSLPGFFRQLLPRGVDTADLLILLLLLLIAGDCEQDRNNALLTIALYFVL